MPLGIVIQASQTMRKFSIFSGGLATHGSGFTIPLSGQNPGTGHSVWVSGAGMINSIITHQAISGAAGQLYDSTVPALSGVGTVPASGYGILAFIPANSWDSPSALAGPVIVPLEVPFSSGIAVNAASGVCGFTVTYTLAGTTMVSGG